MLRASLIDSDCVLFGGEFVTLSAYLMIDSPTFASRLFWSNNDNVSSDITRYPYMFSDLLAIDDHKEDPQPPTAVKCCLLLDSDHLPRSLEILV